MKRAVALACGLGAALLSATPARAWDELGHRVVARIAWDNLTPAARAAAVRLLRAAPADAGLASLMPSMGTEEERGRELFVMASYWPDFIRSRNHPGNRFAHSDWHYVNWFWEQRCPGCPPIDRPDVPRLGELLNVLPVLQRGLGDAAVADSNRAVGLAWILHLVGDVHQPMHNNSRITQRDTAGDLGGNLFELRGIYPYNNLHAYWDALVGQVMPWGAGDRSEADYVGSIAARIQAAHPRPRGDARLLPGRFEEWSRRGAEIAKRSYGTPRGERPSAAYRHASWRSVEGTVALGGYRLADLLNRILAP